MVKLLFLRKLSFLTTREVPRVLLAADSEKRAQNIDFRPKTGEFFKKNGNFRRIEFSPEVILVPENGSKSPSLTVLRAMAPV